MGLRFRKSINFGGVRINLSKSGIGYSVGTQGARITKTADGKTRTTLSLPGTGVSYVAETGKTSPSNQNREINKPIKANDDIVDIGVNVEYIPKRGILGTYKKR